MYTGTQQKVSKFIQNFLLSWVEISETQTSYRIPTFVYIIFQIIYFTQTLANVIYLKDREQGFQDIQYFFQATTLVDLLYGSQSQSAVWVFYVVSHFFVVSILVFALYLGYKRYKNQNAIFGRNTFLQSLYELVNTAISIYVYCFFEPITKLNFGITFAGNNSFFFSAPYRQTFTENYAIIIGVFGTIFNITIQILTIYFFRNFEYNDQNAFKRKYSIVCFIILTIKILLCLSFIVDTNRFVVQVLAIIFGILTVYDSLNIRPFLNQQLAKSYICLSIMYTTIVILNAVRENNYIEEYSMLAMTLWIGPLAAQLGLILYEQTYMRTIHVLSENMTTDYKYFNLYSEEILQLYNQSQSDENPKMILHMLFRLHIVSCRNPDCFSYQLVSKVNDKVTYSLKLLILLVNQMFKVALSNQAVIDDGPEYENVSLKYISFIQKYLENSLLSYYFLKKLANNQKSLSYYFSLLFEIHSDKLKNQLKLINIGLQNNNKLEQKGNDGLRFYTEGIQQVEEMTQEFTDNLTKVVTYKLQIWQQTLINSNTMDDLMIRIYHKIKKVMKLRLQIIDLFKQNFGPDHAYGQKFNAGYHKLWQLYQLFVMNDVVEVGRLEQKIQDLKKRDQYKEETFLNNHNFMNGNSVIIQAGLSIENGKILNRQNQKIPQFFGFNQVDWERVVTINHLMPAHISILHNQILAQYLSKGFSPLMTTARKIFLINKENYLFPVSISVRNDYLSLQDCVFNVTLLKISSNKELIMFDEFGKIIGLSKHLFQILSNDGGGGNQNQIEYDFIRTEGYIQLMCPTFIRVFDGVRKELQDNEKMEDVMALPLQNLQCSLLLPLDFKEISDAYHKFNVKSKAQQQYSLLDGDDSVKISNFIQKHKGFYLPQHIQQRLRLKFTMHAFYRNFEGIDERILRSITSDKTKVTIMSSMRYYVLECQEVFKLRTKIKRRFGVKMQSGQEQNGPTVDNPLMMAEIEDIDEGYHSHDESLKPESFDATLNRQLDDLQVFDYEYKDDSVSEMKDPVLFQDLGLQGVVTPGEEAMTPRDEAMTPRSQINSISSPINSQKFLFKSSEELDVKKKSFLLKMLSFQRRRFEVVHDFPKVDLQDQEDIIWPIELGFQNEKPSQLNHNKHESGLKMMNSIQADQENQGSQIADSENDLEEEDRQSGGKKQDKSKREIQVNLRRERFEQDISSQNSKVGAGNIYSLTYMFLETKKPKQYYRFSTTIIGLFVTVTAYTIIQILFSTQGFSALEDFNSKVDTAYYLQSAYCKSTTGVILNSLDKKGVLKRRFDLPINQNELFQKYQHEGLLKILQVIQTRFSLLRMVQNLLGIEDINVIEFYDQTAEHLNGLSNETNENYYNSLIYGIAPNYVVTSTLNQLISDQLKTQVDSLINYFFIVFYIALTLVLCQTFFILSIYKSFLKFQEKMLLVFTRINLGEYENEVAKLEFGKQYLKDTKGSHIVTQDFVPIFMYFRLKKNSEAKERDDGQDEKKSNVKNFGLSKGQILSSRIYNPTLSIRSQIMQFIVIGLLLVIYLVGAIIFAIQTPGKLSYISDYYLKYSSQFTTIEQIMIYTEIKGAQPFLFQKPSELGEFSSFDNFESYYNGLLDTLNQFTSQDKVFIIKQLGNDQIIQLLYGNLCLKNATIPQRETLDLLCQSELNGIYNNGIIGMIKSLLILFYSYQQQIDSRFNQTIEQSQNFLSLSENWALLILFPDTFGAAIDGMAMEQFLAALGMIQKQLIAVTQDLGQSLLIYLSVSGVCIDMILFIYFYFHFKDLNKRISAVEFLVTLIPFEKLQEATIMQMIKQIQQY